MSREDRAYRVVELVRPVTEADAGQSTGSVQKLDVVADGLLEGYRRRTVFTFDREAPRGLEALDQIVRLGMMLDLGARG